MPHSSDLGAELAHRADVGRHPVVTIVSTEDRTHPGPLSRQWLVSAEPQLRFDLTELGSQPLAHGMAG